MFHEKHLLHEISEHTHRTGYGTVISIELIQVFRIKNLFLFAFRLLQKYEQLTLHACAQINKTILTKQLNEKEKEIQRLEKEISIFKEQIATLEAQIETLRKQLLSMDNNLLPSGASKATALCNMGAFLEPNIFISCEGLFYKTFNDSKFNDQSANLIPQRPPIEYYQNLMYLQMHFDLLLVQGCNHALPILTTRMTFFSRIVYWPLKPFYGFMNKTRKFKKKLLKLKLQITASLEELINAIGEVEKWVLFYQNSHQIYNTLLKAVCMKKKENLFQLNNLMLYFKSLSFEHNRIVGAIVKCDPNFFKGNEDQLDGNVKSENLSSISLTAPSSSTSLSAFSINSQTPKEDGKKLISNAKFDSVNVLPIIQPERQTQTILPRRSKSGMSNSFLDEAFKKETSFSPKSTKIGCGKKSPEKSPKLVFKDSSKTSDNVVSIPKENSPISQKQSPKGVSICSFKTPLFCKPPASSKNVKQSEKKKFFCKSPCSLVNLSGQAQEKIPKIGKSQPRLQAINSLPDDNLHCRCVNHMPPMDEIRQMLLKDRNPPENQNNNIIFSILKELSCDNRRENNNSSGINTDRIFEGIKNHPKFLQIDKERYESLDQLKGFSNENNIETNKRSVFSERPLIWNFLSQPDINISQPQSSRIISNQKIDYYNILNHFLESCGLNTAEFREKRALTRFSTDNFESNVIDSLDHEHELLSKYYTVSTLNYNEKISPLISNRESQLMASLKLYSKYLY